MHPIGAERVFFQGRAGIGILAGGTACIVPRGAVGGFALPSRETPSGSK